MDIGKSISFVFEDQQWLPKVLVGGLVIFATIALSWTVIGLIVGAALLMGYSLDLLKNVRNGVAQPLPEWDNWGDKIVKGFKLGVILFIWSLPIMVFTIPSMVLGAAGDNSSAAGFLAILAFCFACFQILFGLLLTVLMPAIMIKFAETEEFADGFAFAEIFRFTRENIGEIIIALLVIWAVQLVAGLVGLLLCGVGLFFTGFWGLAVQAHLFGQIGRDKNNAFDEPPSSYDLSPDDVMPGVGELMEEVESSANDAVLKVEDLGDSVHETGTDAVDSTAEAVDDASDAASDIFEQLPDDSEPKA